MITVRYLTYLFIGIAFLFIIPFFDTSKALACSYTPVSSNTVNSSVSIPESGTYTVWSRLNAPDSVNNSVYLQIDNGCAVNVGDNASIPVNSFTWVDYQDGTTSTAVLLSLTSGSHTIKLTEREGALGLTSLFSQQIRSVPTGTGTNCPLPTATIVILPTNTPTPTPPPTPTPAGDTTPPTVSINYPINGSTVIRKSNVTIAATATDNTYVMNFWSKMRLYAQILLLHTPAAGKCQIQTTRNMQSARKHMTQREIAL